MKIYKPMLTRTADTPFSSKDWIFEVKWDGIRAICYVYDDLSIKSRNQKELRDNFPELHELQNLTKNIVLDGEIIILREGKIDFQSLIKRVQASGGFEIESLSKSFPATYVVFDVLELEGKPLVDKSLLERKAILKNQVKEGRYVIHSLFADGEGEAYYKAVIDKGLEGIVAKKKQSPYESGRRSNNWLRIKKVVTCDCVVFGYTEGKGRREKTFGALVLGLYDKKQQPVFVGKVGTGFTDDTLENLTKTFQELKSEEKILDVGDISDKITWLNPILICQVEYQSATEDNKLRLPRFRGLRFDKTPLECTLDQIKPSPLKEYFKKRDFSKTPEPMGSDSKGVGKSFVVQEHDARRLHYDLRLEKEGVLKSWAVPKGIPEEPEVKRLAIQTEDHPLDYGNFEGIIPKGQYGAGTVKIWDAGLYEPLIWDKQKIEFLMQGKRLSGRYILVKMSKSEKKEWLLFKARD
jgi:DNA ligase D-like protein (predicted ligase)/DNA ligase D-like protein (predicted 3'-phosphoesterase)